MTVADIPENILYAIDAHSLVPLVGSGLSRQAQTTNADAFPTWAVFLESLVKNAVKADRVDSQEKDEILGLIKKGRFLLAAQAVRDVLPDDLFADAIRELFRPDGAEPGQVHKDLLALRPPVILTTNYDRLLEDAYSAVHHHDATSWTYHRADTLSEHLRDPSPRRKTTCMFKMHGDVSNPGDVVLSEKDYRKLLVLDERYRETVFRIFQDNTVLMLGFSGDDPELEILFRTLNEYFYRERNPDYLLLPQGKKGPVERRLFRDIFSIQIIEYDPRENHRELVELVHQLAERHGKTA